MKRASPTARTPTRVAVLALAIAVAVVAIAAQASALAVGDAPGGGAAVAHDGYIVRFKDAPGGAFGALGEQGMGITYAVAGTWEEAAAIPAELVEYIEPNYLVELLGSEGAPDDPLYAELQWSLQEIGAESAFAAGLDGSRADGSRVKIGFIDSGIRATHEDLDAARVSGRDFVGDGRGYDADLTGHGSFAAGVVAAQTGNGVGLAGLAPGAEIIEYRAFGGKNATMAAVLEAFGAAIADGCDVLNLSFGTKSDSRALQEAVRAAEAAGMVLVAAVGNDGGTAPVYPASYTAVIGVGSVKQGLVRSSFSQRNASVFVAAPGEGIIGLSADADDGYRQDKGTSFSTPVVAGMAALALGYDADVTEDGVRWLLRETATDLGAPGYDHEYGYGAVDVAAFVAALAAPYAIEYALNGGELPLDAPREYFARDDALQLPLPSRAGYRFEGWREMEDLSGPSVSWIPAGSLGDRAYYAAWAEEDAEATTTPTESASSATTAAEPTTAATGTEARTETTEDSLPYVEPETTTTSTATSAATATTTSTTTSAATAATTTTSATTTATPAMAATTATPATAATTSTATTAATATAAPATQTAAATAAATPSEAGGAQPFGTPSARPVDSESAPPASPAAETAVSLATPASTPAATSGAQPGTPTARPTRPAASAVESSPSFGGAAGSSGSASAGSASSSAASGGARSASGAAPTPTASATPRRFATAVPTPAPASTTTAVSARAPATATPTPTVADAGLPQAWANPYLDIAGSDWFYWDVAFVQQRGVMGSAGAGEARFEPGEPMSRAMLVTALWRLAGAPGQAASPDGGEALFADVPADAWHAPAVAWASRNGVANGVGDGLFAPDSAITREEAAVFLCRFARGLGVRGGQQGALGFADVGEASDWALDGIRFCTAAKLIIGKPGNLFDPAATATRAEAAAILHRFGDALP